MTNKPNERMEPEMAKVQPGSPAEPETEASAEGANPSTLAPGLLMFNADSDNACTDDGCMVTFTKG